MSIEQRVRPEVRAMARPRHGGDVWGRTEVRDFSSNVNPLGPPDRLGEYIAEAARDMENYPDDSCEGLKGAIASQYDVPPENIMVGAGSAELIRLFPEVFVRPGDRVVMPRPTFSEYGFACRLMGAEISDLPLPEDDSFRLDISSMIEAMVPETKAVYVCNPNNPTARMRGRGIALVAGAKMGQRSAAQQAQVQEQQHQAEMQTQKAQMEAQMAQQQAQQQAQAASAPKVDITAELQKLAQLHQSGVLSDAEFATAKQKLLSQ